MEDMMDFIRLKVTVNLSRELVVYCMQITGGTAIRLHPPTATRSFIQVPR